ncbi:MAG: hypothetical protein IKN32_00955 [Bacteroidales bacterium]|nr:hypothetical protein [Bacteroidales bacterium]
MSRKPNFRIYPSLLDKFQELIDYEIAAEESWNLVSEAAAAEGKYPGKEAGDYILTPDEMSDKLNQELLDAVNRVPHEPWEAADKGTAFNEVIDMIIAARPCLIDDMAVVQDDNGNYVVSYHCFEWVFDGTFCREFAGGLCDSASQVFTNATIETDYGTVELYGYIDEWQHDKVIDIKTTGSYDFLKFERRWQRHVYPYCLTENGSTVTGFEYRVVKWKGGTKAQPALSGEVIPEYYTYDHEQSKAELRTMLERFIEWLQANADKITDRKVFAGGAGVCVVDGVESRFFIGEEFSHLPKNLGQFKSMEAAFQALAEAGLFATSEGTDAKCALDPEELKELRASITDIVENERIDAAKAVADALAYEERMKAEIKRRKEKAQAILQEIDDRIMEKAVQVKENQKKVVLSATDTIRVSVSDKNLYYHLEDGVLVLASVGYASNDEMSGLFYQAEVNERAMAGLFGISEFDRDKSVEVVKIAERADEELIGREMVCDPERTYFEDFVDEDSGQVLTSKRTEKFGQRDLPVEIDAELLDDLREGGFDTIILRKEEAG